MSSAVAAGWAANASVAYTLIEAVQKPIYKVQIKRVGRRALSILLKSILDLKRTVVGEYPGARAAPPAGRGDPPDLCEGVCKKKQHRGARARGHGQPFARTGPRQQLGAP